MNVNSSGTMPMLTYLEIRSDVPEPLAAASSLVDRKNISRMVAAILSVAVSPIAAMAVTVVTVVVDTVVIITFSYTVIRILALATGFVKPESTLLGDTSINKYICQYLIVLKYYTINIIMA
jgi:hypothetical protein